MASAAGARAGPRPTPAKAGLTDWLAVIAGTLGSFMALLDISIVNAALPTIQGEIGATGTEGTWIATAYLVAEIIIIPLAAWLSRLLGLRTFLMIVVTLFTSFSVLCGLSATLQMMIVGRVGQGLTGGALIPTAQTIIATRLPRSQQRLGMTLLGVTGTLGPLVGPVVGGWLTESVSWHYAFFLNLPVGVLLVFLLAAGLPHERLRLDLFGEADWLGILGLTLGLGGLTVVLEEGQRELWFDSPVIQMMAAVSAVGFALLALGQATARSPVIKLRLMKDRQFGAVAIVGVVLGMVIYGTSYAIPQFLSAIADYNALQSGQVVLLSGIPSLAMVVIGPLLLAYLNIRIAVAVSLVIMASSAFLDADLTILSTGGAFVLGQLMRGVGQVLGMMFLNQASVASVPKEDAGDAAGIFNAARNLGGSLVLAGISVIQDRRVWLHSRRMEETLHANAVSVQDYVAGMAQSMGGTPTALRQIGGMIQQQALVMTFNDIFWLLGAGTLMVLPVALLLRPLPRDGEMAVGH